MTRWGRATFQMMCTNCKRTIEDGESILFRKFGDGILCRECGRSALRREAA